MATINLVRDVSSGFGVAIGWTPLANGDDGWPWDTQDFSHVCVQVLGTFGSGGNLKVEGSNEVTPTNWALLNDAQGSALDITAAKIEQVAESPRWIRPRVSAGDGSTALTVRLWGVRRR